MVVHVSFNNLIHSPDSGAACFYTLAFLLSEINVDGGLLGSLQVLNVLIVIILLLDFDGAQVKALVGHLPDDLTLEVLPLVDKIVHDYLPLLFVGCFAVSWVLNRLK